MPFNTNHHDTTLPDSKQNQEQNLKMGKLWPRNYYEHIIRNEKSYQRISQYIINNPAKWQDDKFYRI